MPADQSNSSTSLLSISEAADMAKVSSNTLRSWADKGLVPSQKTSGGQRRFKRLDIEDLASKAFIINSQLKKQQQHEQAFAVANSFSTNAPRESAWAIPSKSSTPRWRTYAQATALIAVAYFIFTSIALTAIQNIDGIRNIVDEMSVSQNPLALLIFGIEYDRDNISTNAIASNPVPGTSRVLGASDASRFLGINLPTLFRDLVTIEDSLEVEGDLILSNPLTFISDGTALLSTLTATDNELISNTGIGVGGANTFGISSSGAGSFSSGAITGDLTVTGQVTLGDASDTVTLSGSSLTLGSTTDIILTPNSDADDYIYFTTDADQPALLFAGIADTYAPGIRINATSGQLEYRDQNSSAWSTIDSLEDSFTSLFTDGGDYLYPASYEAFRLYDSGGTTYIELTTSGDDLTLEAGSFLVGSGTPTSIDKAGGDLYVSDDLEVDGTIYGNISGSLDLGFTQGSVLFTDASGVIAQDNSNLFWDDTNKRLGIGTSSPSNFTLEVAGDVGPSATNTHSLGSFTTTKMNSVNQSVETIAAASYIGDPSRDWLGRYVYIPGDINNDGYDDILMSSRGDSVHVIFGKATGWTMDQSAASTDVIYNGSSGDGTGDGLASGDVNGDGITDFLIGSSEGPTNTGETYVIFGKTTGWSSPINIHSNTADASFEGETTSDYTGGKAIASGGDVNGDGYDDIVIGSEYNSEGGSNAGQTYLVLGQASGWTLNTNLASADASFIGEAADDRAGWGVDIAGDVNGDGYDDILIGTTKNGAGISTAQAYLILGKASGWTMDQDLSTADASFVATEDLGKVLGVGDVNGDGYDDFFVGGYLVMGRPSGWSTGMDLTSMATSFNAYPNDGRDINGDGFADILFGVTTGDSNVSYLVLGQSTGWSGSQNVASIAAASYVGENTGDGLGDYNNYAYNSAHMGGDIDGDGFFDLVLGAPYNDEGGSDDGQSYVVLSDPLRWKALYAQSLHAKDSIILGNGLQLAGNTIAGNNLTLNARNTSVLGSFSSSGQVSAGSDLTLYNDLIQNTASNLRIDTPVVAIQNDLTIAGDATASANLDVAGVLTITNTVDTEQPMQALGLSQSSFTFASAALGYRFSPNINGRVSQLGLNCAAGTYDVHLYRQSDGAQLATTSITTTGLGTWVYADISPVNLTSGTQYVVSYETPSIACYTDLDTGGTRPYDSGNIEMQQGVYTLGTGSMPTTELAALTGLVDITFLNTDASSGLMTIDGSIFSLNGGYISNDGDSEGLRISDSGDASVSASLVFEGGTSSIDILDGANLAFNTSAGGDAGLTTAMTLTQDGYLGIGTTSPAYALDISGDARITNSIGLLGADPTPNYGVSSLLDTDLQRGIFNDINISVSGTAILRAYGVYNDTLLEGSSSNPGYSYGITNIGTISNRSNGVSVLNGSNNVFTVESTSTSTSTITGLQNTLTQQGTAGTFNIAQGVYNIMRAANDSYSQVLYGVRTDLTTYAGASDVAYGTYISDSSASTGGTQYGLYIDLDDVDVTSYSLYVADGSGSSYLGSAVGIGDISPEGLLDIEGAAIGQALVQLNETGDQDIFTASSSGTPRFTITNAGDVGIGTSLPGARLHVTDDVDSDYAAEFYNDGNNTNRYGMLIQAGLDDGSAAGPSTLIDFADGDGGAVGSITFGSSLTAYNTTSDERLKEGITHTRLGLQDLMNIQVRDYSFIADSAGKVHTGFIAQELNHIYPDAVTAYDDGRYWQVDYGKLTPLIISAIQDQQAEIDSGFMIQDSRITSIQNQLAQVMGVIELSDEGDVSIEDLSSTISSLEDRVGQLEASQSASLPTTLDAPTIPDYDFSELTTSYNLLATKLASVSASLDSLTTSYDLLATTNDLLRTDIDLLMGDVLGSTRSAFSTANAGGASDSAFLTQVQPPASSLQPQQAATISGLLVSGDTILNNLAVTGDTTLGLITIDGIATNISTLGFEPLRLQTNPLAGIELAGGTVVIDPRGNMVIGGDLHLLGDLVGTDQIRGIDEPVLESSTSHDIIFTTPKEDNQYALTVTPGWPTELWIQTKATASATIRFTQPAPPEATIDWILVR